MQKHCICIKTASFSWHKRILKALAVLTTCITYTKEDRYVDVTMFTEIGGEGSKMTTGREEVHTSLGVSYATGLPDSS